MAEVRENEILLIESQYFPNIACYKNLVKHNTLMIEKYEHYQKVSFRNRCYVAGPNGRILLSVPLTKGKNQRTLMKDVKISNDEPWQSQQWKTLVSAYRRSPWFEYHEDDLGELYNQPFEFLLDWNMACFEWANKVLGISELDVQFTTEYKKSYEAGVEDARDQLEPGGDFTGLAPEYTQVFQDRTGFLPNLSILDLIFCEGKRGLDILKNPL
jgi:hypothetical protein